MIKMELDFTQILESYDVTAIDEHYSVRQSEDLNAILRDGRPLYVLKGSNKNIYNKIFDFEAKAQSIEMEKDFISIDFTINTEKYKDFSLDELKVKIGYGIYDFTVTDGLCNLKMPYGDIDIGGKSAGIFLFFEDENGFRFKKKFLSMEGPRELEDDYVVYTSKIKKYNNHSIYVYETFRGYLNLVYREVNVTDSPREQRKIRWAYKRYLYDVEHGRNTPSVLLYEKFCSKYEESAKFVFERLIDDGCENVFFILDKKSEYYRDVPKKYRRFILNKNSLRHYYEYFNAKVFIASETFFHAVEVTNSNSLIRIRQKWDDYYYFFLQHGVSYAFALKDRNSFKKGSGFTDNSFIAVSSECEANHFIEQAKFDRADLVKSGMPKFDHSIQNDDADKILIMPTTRFFEYSTIMDDAESSTYYNFSKRIIESVPDELKDKIVFIPHPIVNRIMKKTDLERYMSDETKYDKLLQDTRLLITDYSSISFDAFYRGCNVVFAWMEKDMCLERLGFDLMLNDDNSFADIAYDYDTLGELILKNYDGGHSDEHSRKFKEIVEFDDARNTERFVEYIYDTNAFPQKAKRADIADAEVSDIADRAYVRKTSIEPKFKVSYNGKKLIRNIDFDVKFKDNKAIGTATIEIIGKGIYYGKKTVNFNIKRNIRRCKFEINGNDLSVKYKDEELTEGNDYAVDVLTNFAGVDINKISITGIGEYAGRKNILIDVKSVE